MDMRTGAERAKELKPFTAGGNAYGMPNFRGGPAEGRTGALSKHPAWLSRYYADANAIDYVIYSYHTPIAWHTPDGWVIPPVKYSISTTRHQGTLYRLSN